MSSDYLSFCMSYTHESMSVYYHCPGHILCTLLHSQLRYLCIFPNTVCSSFELRARILQPCKTSGNSIVINPDFFWKASGDTFLIFVINIRANKLFINMLFIIWLWSLFLFVYWLYLFVLVFPLDCNWKYLGVHLTAVCPLVSLHTFFKKDTFHLSYIELYSIFSCYIALTPSKGTEYNIATILHTFFFY